MSGLLQSWDKSQSSGLDSAPCTSRHPPFSHVPSASAALYVLRRDLAGNTWHASKNLAENNIVRNYIQRRWHFEEPATAGGGGSRWEPEASTYSQTEETRAEVEIPEAGECWNHEGRGNPSRGFASAPSKPRREHTVCPLLLPALALPAGVFSWPKPWKAEVKGVRVLQSMEVSLADTERERVETRQ